MFETIKKIVEEIAFMTTILCSSILYLPAVIRIADEQPFEGAKLFFAIAGFVSFLVFMGMCAYYNIRARRIFTDTAVFMRDLNVIRDPANSDSILIREQSENMRILMSKEALEAVDRIIGRYK